MSKQEQIGSTSWYRVQAGEHRKGQFTITREVDDNGKLFWACRFAGKIFDRADTLAEAKSYCQ